MPAETPALPSEFVLQILSDFIDGAFHGFCCRESFLPDFTGLVNDSHVPIVAAVIAAGWLGLSSDGGAAAAQLG